MGSVMILMTVLWASAVAQSGCTNVLIGMAPCLNYVTGSSSTPTSSCCSSLASVVQSQPQCLCTALNGGGAALGISINQTLALALPGACNVKTPPVSLCDGKKNIKNLVLFFSSLEFISIEQLKHLANEMQNDANVD